MRPFGRPPPRGAACATAANAVVVLVLACALVATAADAPPENVVVHKQNAIYNESPYPVPLSVCGHGLNSTDLVVKTGGGHGANGETERQLIHLSGHSRWRHPHKAFHHLSLEVFDQAGFVSNECELRFHGSGDKVRTRKGPGWPTLRDTLKGLRTGSKLREDKDKQKLPALTAKFAPFADVKIYVRLSCLSQIQRGQPFQRRQLGNEKTLSTHCFTSNAGDCCPHGATYSSCVLDVLPDARTIRRPITGDC